MTARPAIVVVSLLLAGCSALPGPPEQTEASHEHSSQAPPPERPASSAPTEITAIESFASAYINWSALTPPAHLRQLAAASIGQARAEMALAAAGAARDYELTRGGVANSGTVEAVAPLRGSRIRFAVVTLERTSATNTTAYAGLRPQWHVTIATVSAVPGGGWVVSGWQPES